MLIRGDMVVFFFIWILELSIFLVLNIQVTSKRLGTCGRIRKITTDLGEWVDGKDSRIYIYVDLEERWEREGRKDPRWMKN